MKLGTRGSALALWQANWAKSELEKRWPGLVVELVPIKTTGDKILDAPLAKIGGKGLFTKEIDEALLDGRIDLAVHSLKDVPFELPAGIAIGAVPEREDPRDAFISNGPKLHELGPNATIGTSVYEYVKQMVRQRIQTYEFVQDPKTGENERIVNSLARSPDMPESKRPYYATILREMIIVIPNESGIPRWRVRKDCYCD